MPNNGIEEKMSTVSGGRVWDLSGQIRPAKKSFAWRKFILWAVCISTVTAFPLIIMAHFDFPVWYSKPTGITSVAGGFVDQYDAFLSWPNFFLWLGVMTVSTIGVILVNKKFKYSANAFIIIALVGATVMTSTANNDVKSSDFDGWVKDTYGYTSNQRAAPTLDKSAINVRDANGVKTTLNILRSDSNIYLYKNVVEEEQLRAKIKSVKEHGE